MEQPLIEVIGRQKHLAITWLLTREKVAAAAHPTAYATACGSEVRRQLRLDMRGGRVYTSGAKR